MVKEAVLRIAANTASAQLGSLAVGLNIFARFCEITYWVNTELGNNGFKITINCIYEQHYIHSQGYYMYGWNITSATARTY